MKKVLQITSALYRNGTETFIMNVFRKIDRNKVSFDFLLQTHVEGGYEEEAKELGANLYYYTPRKKNLKKYFTSINQFFKENAHRYNAVHFHGMSFTDIYPLVVARKYGIKTRIVHTHSYSTHGLHNRLLHKYYKSRIHKLGTHWLACSKEARVWGYGGNRIFNKSVTVPNGIDMEKFQFNKIDRITTRKKLGIDPSSFTICHVGAFRAVKNHTFLIDIFKEIYNQHPNSVLLLCGEGPTEKEIREKIKNEGLIDSVIFLGQRKKITDILSASDVFIFPSKYEGLGFALIEAQANGIPVLTSDTVPREVKLTEHLKFLPLHTSPKNWADEALSERGKERIYSEISTDLKKYDIKATCDILRSIYL